MSKKRKAPKWPTVEMVEWSDSCSSRAGWEYVEDIAEWGKTEFVIHSIGHVVYEDDNCIVISMSYGIHNDTATETMRIPKGCIMKRTLVAEAVPND